MTAYPDPIRGTRIGAHPRHDKPRQHDHNRTCVTCQAPISRYNGNGTCWAHTAKKVRSVRGEHA